MEKVDVDNMRVCPKCGRQIDDDTHKFCLNCGTALPIVIEENIATNQNTSYGYSAPVKDKYPMKWFKFLIYFSLFAGALINLSVAINYLTGDIYFTQTNGWLTAEMVYRRYGMPLKVWDVFYGLVVLGLAVFSIVTRFSLAKYKANGPGFLYTLYFVGGIAGLVYNLGAALITCTSGVFDSSYIASIIVTVIFVLANYKYFSKREELFCN